MARKGGRKQETKDGHGKKPPPPCELAWNPTKVILDAVRGPGHANVLVVVSDETHDTASVSAINVGSVGNHAEPTVLLEVD
mmetsp:Transcript_91/g.218  ORF Transcript_91/g.218 Transcript_91/m.218 type:complete len:81 (-) Transcript_91:1148-1390(-)